MSRIILSVKESLVMEIDLAKPSAPRIGAKESIKKTVQDLGFLVFSGNLAEIRAALGALMHVSPGKPFAQNYRELRDLKQAMAGKAPGSDKHYDLRATIRRARKKGLATIAAEKFLPIYDQVVTQAQVLSDELMLIRTALNTYNPTEDPFNDQDGEAAAELDEQLTQAAHSPARLSRIYRSDLSKIEPYTELAGLLRGKLRTAVDAKKKKALAEISDLQKKASPGPNDVTPMLSRIVALIDTNAHPYEIAIQQTLELFQTAHREKLLGRLGQERTYAEDLEYEVDELEDEVYDLKGEIVQLEDQLASSETRTEFQAAELDDLERENMALRKRNAQLERQALERERARDAEARRNAQELADQRRLIEEQQQELLRLRALLGMTGPTQQGQSSGGMTGGFTFGSSQQSSGGPTGASRSTSRREDLPRGFRQTPACRARGRSASAVTMPRRRLCRASRSCRRGASSWARCEGWSTGRLALACPTSQA